MIVKCSHCGKEFNRKPSTVKGKNYCCKECRHADKVETVKCDNCGQSFEKWKDYVYAHNFCCRECARVFTSERMTAYNADNNPTAMTQQRRLHIRDSRLGKGVGKTYEKTFGRHTHRIVAEQILGRPLKPGEVVHHINEDKRDNRPENLMVFANQRQHALWHKTHEKTGD